MKNMFFQHIIEAEAAEAAEAATTTTAVVESFEVLRGYGVRGRVNQLEMVVASGNYLQTLGVETVDDGDAVTRAYVVQQGRLQGYIEMSDELRPDAVAAIEEWATIFTEPTKLSKTVGKNWLLHGRTIKADIAKEEADWSSGDYFNAGVDTAMALTEAVGS